MRQPVMTLQNTERVLVIGTMDTGLVQVFRRNEQTGLSLWVVAVARPSLLRGMRMRIKFSFSQHSLHFYSIEERI